MPTRRVVLQVFSSIAIPPKFTATKEDICLLRAQQLGEAMKDLHGGEWEIAVDHVVRTGVVFQKGVA